MHGAAKAASPNLSAKERGAPPRPFIALRNRHASGAPAGCAWARGAPCGRLEERESQGAKRSAAFCVGCCAGIPSPHRAHFGRYEERGKQGAKQNSRASGRLDEGESEAQGKERVAGTKQNERNLTKPFTRSSTPTA